MRIARYLLAAAALLTACGPRQEIILASTTSTLDSGLFDALLPAFEREHPDISVKVIAVGSGEAMALGRRRDADVLLVHSPADENAFMTDGHGERRMPVMKNDFVILGPASDPAGIRDSRDAAAALRAIAAAGQSFVSRGDSSGTHRKEMALREAAGVGSESVTEVGQGMGEALAIASEREAYILSDRGTYLALSPSLELDVLVEGDPRLENPYSVITVRGARNAAAAGVFADWIVSRDAAAIIRSFGIDRFGQPLFFPARSD